MPGVEEVGVAWRGPLSPKCLTHGDNYRLAESKRFKSKILKIEDKEKIVPSI